MDSVGRWIKNVGYTGYLEQNLMSRAYYTQVTTLQVHRI